MLLQANPHLKMLENLPHSISYMIVKTTLALVTLELR